MLWPHLYTESKQNKLIETVEWKLSGTGRGGMKWGDICQRLQIPSYKRSKFEGYKKQHGDKDWQNFTKNFKIAKRVNLKWFHLTHMHTLHTHTHRHRHMWQSGEVMEVLIKLTVVIILQYMCIKSLYYKP